MVKLDDGSLGESTGDFYKHGEGDGVGKISGKVCVVPIQACSKYDRCEIIHGQFMQKVQGVTIMIIKPVYRW
jgi:hypothetical protein